MNTRIKIETIGNINQFARIVGETKTNWIVSLQNKETLERHNRCYSKKTLKCRSNTSEFTSISKITHFLNQ